MKPRNAFCSFCRKSHTDVGPLVEGPPLFEGPGGNVYICADCILLCLTIVEQEKRRRNPPPGPVGPTQARARLDQLAIGQDNAKQGLTLAMGSRSEGKGKILLVGPSRSAKTYLARALAHAIDAPFASGDLSELVKSKPGHEAVFPLLLSLIDSSQYDVEAAQRGVLYIDGFDISAVQEAAFRLWEKKVVEPTPGMQFDIGKILFVCGGTFADLGDANTADALIATGANPKWLNHLAAIARAGPLDEETMTRVISWVVFRPENAEPTKQVGPA
jgi:ATP-dependent Clp protease ATP-binding subunit ClpX